MAEGSTRLEDRAVHSIRVRYGKLIAKGWVANDQPSEKVDGKWFQNTARNLLDRLDAYRDDGDLRDEGWPSRISLCREPRGP